MGKRPDPEEVPAKSGLVNPDDSATHEWTRPEIIIVDPDETIGDGGGPVAVVEGGKEPFLLVLAGDAAGKLFRLTPSRDTVIGRGTEADLFIQDHKVSRTHARIRFEPDGRILLTDLESRNGTFLNGAPVKESVLRNGDKVQIGSRTVLKFAYQDQLDQAFQEHQFLRGIKDSQTGAFNRMFFLNQLETEFAYASRHETPLTLLLFDIDHFKSINDEHGHLAGDMVLAELAHIVGKALRVEDLFGRYGGEEFVVLLRDTELDEARVVAERIRSSIEEGNYEFEGKALHVTVSVGIATLNGGSELEGPQNLIQKADEFLYRAKELGRNRVVGPEV